LILPEPGLLHQAAADSGVFDPQWALVIGGLEECLAAVAAGWDFAWASGAVAQDAFRRQSEEDPFPDKPVIVIGRYPVFLW
jgi:hypothetical protein